MTKCLTHAMIGPASKCWPSSPLRRSYTAHRSPQKHIAPDIYTRARTRRKQCISTIPSLSTDRLPRFGSSSSNPTAKRHGTELEPGRKITTRSTSGPTAWEGTYLLEPSGEATRFTLDLRQEATGLGQLLAPLTDGLFRRQWMSDLALLKQVVEARRPAGG